MNKSGRIKLMTKGMTSTELYKLSKWFSEKARANAKDERTHLVTDLGVGGRVVYSASNRDFDVTGKVGTINAINKRKDRYYLEVSFDKPVWEKRTKRYTKKYWEWYTGISDINQFKQDLYKKYQENDGKGSYWQMRNRLMHKEYKKQTGEEPKEEHVQSGHVLIRISPNCLMPATKENIEHVEMHRKQMPAFDALNKIAQDVFKTNLR